MILNLHLEIHYRNRQSKWWFTLDGTDEIVARAVNGIDTYTTLWYGENKYKFKNIPKFVEKSDLDFKYPYSSNLKKTIGFDIFENDSPIAEFHWDALRCREKGINRNIGLNVFKYNGEAYMLFHIGVPKHNSSYFCLYKNGGELVAVIARHHTMKDDDNCMATLYIKDDKYLLITMLACTSKIIDIVNYKDSDDNYDPSAGLLISTLEEERELFDSEFIENVKRQEKREWNIPPLEIPEKDLQLATEMLDEKEEQRLRKKADLKAKILVISFIMVCVTCIILNLLSIDLIFKF